MDLDMASMDLDMVFNFDNMGLSNGLADKFAIFREREKSN